MVVYAAVLDRRAGSRLEAAGSLLAAFDANGECRGVVAIGEGPLGRLYSLSVGIESTSETGFVLKVWDATTGEIHVISETLYANDARQHGAIDDPIVYAFGTLDQIVTLEEGWTWISFALVPEDATVGTLLAGCTFGNGDVIMASDRVVTYYDGSWCPSSYELQPGVAYMVRKTAGGTEQMTVVGVPMSDGLSLDAGWNWFGPTVLATQKVTTVVHSGGFADHDQIKDASSVATQYGGTWYPSDFRLCAGVGYVAKLANSGTLWFGEPMASLSATTAKAALFSVPKLSLCTAAASKPSWKGVTKGNNMVVYADVRDLSTESGLSSDGSLLAAFDVAGECRGVATIEDGPCGRVFQLPVGLESTDETNFVLRIWNAKDATCYKIRERVAANGSRQLGQIFDPISFTTRTDPLPAISVPTQAEIGELLEQADDVKLVEKVTNETEYVAFREWSGKVQPHGGGNAVGAAGVMAAPNAWVSYALGSETLLEAAPTDADLTVEAFEPKSGEDGKFDFTVSVKDVDVGGAATTEAQKETMKENLKQVFGLEGGTSLEEGKMSSANVEIEFGTPVDGKVKFTAGPKDTGTKTFFMKVRVK